VVTGASGNDFVGAGAKSSFTDESLEAEALEADAGVEAEPAFAAAGVTFDTDDVAAASGASGS
jgi:hypothetical protein